jgi:hypothetical protein
MSGYPIYDDDEIDNNYDSEYNFTSTSNPKFKKYFSDKQENNFEDDDSESVGKLMAITMPTENIDKLQYESTFKHVSFNTRINQVIKNHLDWYSNAPLAKMSCIPKSIVTKAIGQLTEQQLSEFAQSTVSNLQEMSLLLRGEFSFSSFLDILNTWLRITQTPNRFDETRHEYKIIIRHDMGYKYSFLLKEVFRLVMKERFHKSFHHNMTENIILIRSAR